MLQVRAFMNAEQEDLTAILGYEQTIDIRDWLLSPLVGDRDAIHLKEVPTVVCRRMNGFETAVAKLWSTTTCLTRNRRLTDQDLQRHGHAIGRLNVFSSCYIQVDRPTVHRLLGYNVDGTTKMIPILADATRRPEGNRVYQANLVQLAPLPPKDGSNSDMALFPFAIHRRDVIQYHSEYNVRLARSTTEYQRNLPSGNGNLMMNDFHLFPRVGSAPRPCFQPFSTPPFPSAQRPRYTVNWGPRTSATYSPWGDSPTFAPHPSAGNTPATGLLRPPVRNIPPPPPTLPYELPEMRGRPTSSRYGSRPRNKSATADSRSSDSPSRSSSSQATRKRAYSASSSSSLSSSGRPGTSRQASVRPRMDPGFPGSFLRPRAPPSSDTSSSNGSNGSTTGASGPSFNNTFLAAPIPAAEPGEIVELPAPSNNYRDSSEAEIFDSDYSEDDVQSCSPTSARNVSIPCITLSSDSSLNTTHGNVSQLDPAPADADAGTNNPIAVDPCIVAFVPADPGILAYLPADLQSSGSGSSTAANTGSPWPTPPSLPTQGSSSSTAPSEAPSGTSGASSGSSSADSAFYSAPSSSSTTASNSPARPYLQVPARADHTPRAPVGIDIHGGTFTISPTLPGFNSSDDQLLSDASQIVERELALMNSSDLDTTVPVVDLADTPESPDRSSPDSDQATASQILADIDIIQASSSSEQSSADVSPAKLVTGEENPPERKAGN